MGLGSWFIDTIDWLPYTIIRKIENSLYYTLVDLAPRNTKQEASMNANLIRFLTKLRNASLVNKDGVVFRNSNIIQESVRALYREGLIQTYVATPEKILVRLRIVDGNAVTNHVQTLSHPTQVKSLSYADVSRISFRRQEGFLTTHQGVKSLSECRKKKLGGIFLFKA